CIAMTGAGSTSAVQRDRQLSHRPRMYVLQPPTPGRCPPFVSWPVSPSLWVSGFRNRRWATRSIARTTGATPVRSYPFECSPPTLIIRGRPLISIHGASLNLDSGIKERPHAVNDDLDVLL